MSKKACAVRSRERWDPQTLKQKSKPKRFNPFRTGIQTESVQYRGSERVKPHARTPFICSEALLMTNLDLKMKDHGRIMHAGERLQPWELTRALQRLV